MASAHLYPVLGDLENTVSSLEQVLTPKSDDFETIVCSGLSGIIPSTVIAHKLHKKLAIVRKKTESRHGADDIETRNHPGRFIIIDDFVQSGDTLQRILKIVQTYSNFWQTPSPICKGIYLYSGPFPFFVGNKEPEVMFDNIPVFFYTGSKWSNKL